MKLFVYGTLRKGERNHYLLHECEFLGEDKVPNLIMLNMGIFPMCFSMSHSPYNSVVVEKYEITDEDLRKIDLLDGFPDLYTRAEFKTESGDKGILYYGRDIEMVRVKHLLVESGDWMKRDSILSTA